MIESVCATFKDFSQKQAEIRAHLECIASEETERLSSDLEPLPELSEGPDEVCLRFPKQKVLCSTEERLNLAVETKSW